MKFRNSIEINEPSDFELVADDILTDWLEGFTIEKGLIREVDEDDTEHFGGEDIVGFMYTQKGMKLYNRACERLKILGLKYFPNEEFDIRSSAVIFP